jgi:hypothetical protein
VLTHPPHSHIISLHGDKNFYDSFGDSKNDFSSSLTHIFSYPFLIPPSDSCNFSILFFFCLLSSQFIFQNIWKCSKFGWDESSLTFGLEIYRLKLKLLEIYSYGGRVRDAVELMKDVLKIGEVLS